MNLYEYEGEKLFADKGIPVADAVVVENLRQARQAAKKFPSAVVKAQTFLGKRKKTQAVVLAEGEEEIVQAVKSLLGKTLRGEKITKALVGERLPVEGEFFISIAYDTRERAPILLASPRGGIDVEELSKKHPRSIARLVINPVEGPGKKELKKVLGRHFPKKVLGQVVDVAGKLWDVFSSYDARLVEINPLILTRKGKLVAADAKVILDDFAFFRHPEVGLTRKDLIGRVAKTEAEVEARAIDEGDYRGTAGSVYFDLPGDIAIIASGGGGSLVSMDALLSYAGRPANYTEYSGNPPREKVEKLTKIALAKPGLSGCWVVGGTANFTDIYETLSGFVAGLRKVKPKPHYPIVIRREGPRTKEAFGMLKKVAQKEGFDIHVFDNKTTVNEAAKMMVRLANAYKEMARNQIIF